MCLKKSVFLDLLNRYPTAKQYFTKRAKERRVEFRRLMKIHLKKMSYMPKLSENEKLISDDSDDSSNDDENLKNSPRVVPELNENEYYISDTELNRISEDEA
jgi:hypothetical protein